MQPAGFRRVDFTTAVESTCRRSIPEPIHASGHSTAQGIVIIIIIVTCDSSSNISIQNIDEMRVQNTGKQLSYFVYLVLMCTHST